MKSDMSRRYHTRVITNIIYSAVISCLVEIFLVTNVSMIARYMEESGRMNRLLQAVLDYHVAVVLVYVVSGLALFAVTFMILQEPYIRYISNISDAVQSISEGNLNTTIDVIGDDEFSSMAANLNRMVEDIRELMDKERESERTKNELITNVAHDLRTPLTSIIGSSDSFTENYAALSDQEKLDLVSSINEDSHWLLNMVENLLSITRIQGDTGRVRKEDELVEEVVAEAITRIKKRIPDIEIHVTAPDNILIIPMDPLLIEQVLMNLMENAFVHSETNRPVELQISEESDTITFHVIDYGKGIDEQTIPLILKGEYHVPKTSDTHRGMGIGLSICNTIVQAHGGQISAHNHAHGAEFLFTLPKGDI